MFIGEHTRYGMVIYEQGGVRIWTGGSSQVNRGGAHIWTTNYTYITKPNNYTYLTIERECLVNNVVDDLTNPKFFGMVLVTDN